MIDELIKHTPLNRLDKAGRADIYIKLECMQFSGSFKARGIVNLLRNINGCNGLVAFTTGNHGVATAAIAQALKIPCIIVSSDHITRYKKLLIESYGATVEIVNFYSLELSVAYAVKIADERNYTFVTLFGNEYLLEGYSHIADEIAKELDTNIIAFLPVGTGSLILGNAKRLKSLSAGNKVIATEPSIYQRLNSNLHVDGQPSHSIADCLSIDKIPATNIELMSYIDGVVPITEDEIISAMIFLYENFDLIVEPGAAVTLSAALKSDIDNTPKVAVITGRNIAPEMFRHYTNIMSNANNAN